MYRPPIVLALAVTLMVPAGVAATSTDGPGLCLEYAAIGTTETLDGVVEVVTARVAQAGSTDATVVATDTGTIEVELPSYTAATDDAEAIAQRLGATSHLAFRPVPSELAHELEAGQPVPEAMAAAVPRTTCTSRSLSPSTTRSSRRPRSTHPASRGKSSSRAVPSPWRSMSWRPC